MTTESTRVGKSALFGQLAMIVHTSKATDLHLVEGERPVLRLARTCLRIPEVAAAPILEHFNDFWTFVSGMAEGRAAFSFEYQPYRVRLTLYSTKGRRAMAFRFQPLAVPTLEKLGLNDEIAHALVDPAPGLVLIAGGPCCGKTTTMASILNHLSKTGNYHIRTFEDPIEYELETSGSLVTQQELGVDIARYDDAVERALGQDVNVMAFGEIRDLPTLRAAIKAANLNMLVFGTIHAPDVTSTLSRVIEEFGEQDRQEASHALKRCIKMIICQKLLIQSPVDDRAISRSLLPSILLTYQAALFKRRGHGPALPYSAMIPDKRLRELAEHFTRARLSEGLYQHPDFTLE